jgi:hypothetical protein
VIRRCGCIILSTDIFHASALPDERFIHAARTIAGEGVWIVAQVIEGDAANHRTAALLRDALGQRWAEYGEIHQVPLLPYGRAANLFHPATTTPGRDFGACHLARSPVIRYDGRTSVCCNEAVIMGQGPDALRRQCDDADELAQAFSDLDRHALLRAIGDIGPGLLTIDPRLQDLSERPYKSICELCWEMVERLKDVTGDPLFEAASALVTGSAGSTG